MEVEIWKPVKDYEGFYSVSSFGNVRSEDRYVKIKETGIRKVRGRILKNNPINYSTTVGLCRDSVSKTFGVHILVATAFVENKDNLPVVRHLDGNETNNHYKNLIWSDYTFKGDKYISKYIRIPEPKYKNVVQNDNDEILEGIIKYVQSECRVDIVRNNKERNVVYARALYFKLASEYSTSNITDIGKKVNKHHSTVLHGVNNVFDTAYRYDEVIKEAYVGFNLAHNVINSDYIMRLRDKLNHAEDAILKVKGYYEEPLRKAI